MAKANLSGWDKIGFAHQRRDGGADLDADRIAFRRKNARVRRTVWRHLAGLILVAVQAIDPDRVERFKVALPHPGEGQPVEPGVVGNEADHAPARLLGNAPLGHAEEAHIEIVQPLALGPAHPLGRAVGVRQFPFLIHRHTGKTVVGRIAQDHEDGRFPLDPLGAVTFFLQLGKWQWLGRSSAPSR